MVINEEREEWEQELREEAYREEYFEVTLRRDYDDFLAYFEEDIEALREVLALVKAHHEAYDWDFDIREFE